MGAKAVTAAAAAHSDIIPADMDELARHYYGFISGMVRKSGIPDQDVPDSVQYILMQLGKPHPDTGKNVIGQFDPEHVTVHQGQARKTRFSTFLGRKVLLYCQGERGRVFRRDSHELKILDGHAGDQAAEALSMQDVLLGASYDDYSGMDAAEAIRDLRAVLAAVPPRSKRDKCDLVALFDEIVAEVEQTGGFTYAGIQDRFGISGTTAGSWLARLRTVLGSATGRALATVGGVALTREQVAAAVKILREAKGIMVAQPLSKAGHPLKDAEKRWYHPFSAEEIRKFPELAIEPGTHRKPAGHVKAAVIHRLERLLAESGASGAGQETPAPPVPAIPAPRPPLDDEPEPEITPEDEFEAALWRHIQAADEVDRIMEMARRAYADVSVS